MCPDAYKKSNIESPSYSRQNQKVRTHIFKKIEKSNYSVIPTVLTLWLNVSCNHLYFNPVYTYLKHVLIVCGSHYLFLLQRNINNVKVTIYLLFWWSTFLINQNLPIRTCTSTIIHLVCWSFLIINGRNKIRN